MLQSVLLYWITIVGNQYYVHKYDDHNIYSAEPIVNCIGFKTKPSTLNSKQISEVYSCKTERLYYHMTGVETVDIIITGKYKI